MSSTASTPHEYPNAEPKPVGAYVRTVHPHNVGRQPDGIVLMSEAGADEPGTEGTVYVQCGRGSTVYGPAKNWRPIERRPDWLEELEQEAAGR